MADKYKRDWSGDDWQAYCHQLIQLRHGAANVQRVPDHVHGDAGLEFFTVDGCAYQCYAPEEVADTKKAASAMKRKASRDLPKLQLNASVLQELLQATKLRRWFLLTPFLDDKNVVAFVRGKGMPVRSAGSHIAHEFEALAHAQEDFAVEIEALRRQPIVPRLREKPSGVQSFDLESHVLGATLSGKLRRAYPGASPEDITRLVVEHLRAYADRENILDALRIDHPMLWDRSISCIQAEERRLVVVGAAGTAAVETLNASLARIEQSLTADLPDLGRSAITEMSIGSLSDWLMRCPLDFPPGVPRA